METAEETTRSRHADGRHRDGPASACSGEGWDALVRCLLACMCVGSIGAIAGLAAPTWVNCEAKKSGF